jgi:hypothetical protein
VFYTNFVPVFTPKLAQSDLTSPPFSWKSINTLMAEAVSWMAFEAVMLESG